MGWVLLKNNTTEEFKDKEGHVVLKRNYDNSVAHDTYYVYDVYGNLTYVLPPKAEGATTAAVLDELCYQYQYDYRNRLVAKKLPGKQWEFMVYDKLDRVVATGPAFSPFSDVAGAGWLITKYDVFNRVVYTGWLNSVQVTSTERSTMQQTQNNATTINESKQATGTIDTIAVNYSNDVAPTSFKLLSVNYYDDYAIPNVSGLATSVDSQTVTTATKGLATGSWMRVATTTAETKGETTSILYDVKFRPIRSYTANYLGGYTSTDSKLDAFSGQLQYTVQKHKRTSADNELTVKEAFTYSPQKRLLTHTHQINGGAEQLLADNTYDELGKLTSKKVGNTSAMPLQNVNYTYNVRGWLTQINEIKALQKGTDPKDLFGFTINYNTVDGSTSAASPLYNGNIAETFWQTGADGNLVYRGYGYKYDSLNRLKDASYQRPGFSNPVPKSYDENLTYDKNGNIMSLKRNGDADDQLNLFPIDDLSYTYLANSNKLMQVTDAQPTATSGFKDGITTGDDYAYDANGNLTVDKNKNITAITYNHLNLPTKIIFTTGNIVYIYTASGQKMQKIVTDGTNTTTTDYLGGYQYQNTVLQFFPTVEGYVKNTPVSGTNSYSYVFNYTDHLGNTRLSYTKDTTGSLKILEENNYYPFGLKHNNYNVDNFQPGYKYKYNGKELQDELGLNMSAMDYRQYDSAIVRFYGADRLAEMAPDISPYRFAFNNPVYWGDPTGLSEKSSNGQAICPTCPNTPEFKPLINDPNNTYVYDPETKKASLLLDEVVVSATRKNQTAQSNNDSSSGLNILDFLYGGGGAIGNELFKNGNYRQTNGNIGNFNDRLFKNLSKNAKAHYNFYKDLKSLKKAGIATTVILGSIEISNGAIQDYKNYTATGATNGKNTVVATAKVGTGIAVGWAASAMTGAAIGTTIPIPVVGTVVGVIVGGVVGYYASERVGGLVEKAYE